jgi:hypothetical protein
MVWQDDEEPPQDILRARTRAKYYEAAYIINRPFLYKVLYPPKDSPPVMPFDYEALSKIDLEYDLFEPEKGFNNTGVRCRVCIIAALKSAVVFDGLMRSPESPLTKGLKLPNIHGTAAV